MSIIDLVLTKYNTESNYIVTFEEMIQDFQTLEPTKIPIIDITIFGTLGKYIYQFINYHKWNVSPNLEDELVNMIISLSDKTKNINVDDLKIIFQKYNNKHSPDSYEVENELFKFVEEIIKKNLPMLQLNDLTSLKEYMDFRMNFQKEYKIIMDKYKIDWNDIEIKINNISNIITIKFDELEDLPEFEDTFNMLENVNNKVNIKMEKLIKFTNDLIQQAKEQSSCIIGYNGVMLFEQLKKEIMNSFNKEMDVYFENEIKSLNFDDTVNNMLIQLYDVEKSMYRFSVSLSIIEHGIKNY